MDQKVNFVVFLKKDADANDVAGRLRVTYPKLTVTKIYPSRALGTVLIFGTTDKATYEVVFKTTVYTKKHQAVEVNKATVPHGFRKEIRSIELGAWEEIPV